MRRVSSKAYTFFIIYVDRLSIIRPVILKFMKKKAAMKTTTLNKLRLIANTFKVS